MKPKTILTFVLLALIGGTVAAQAQIRPGEVLKRTFADSSIYPGTFREYWIYVPAGYDEAVPACLYVAMDGISYNAPAVMDTLIARREIPMMIGVFVSSGIVRDESGRDIRYNRSNEFDKTDGTFARFLLEELLPDAEKQKTSDGRQIRFSQKANDRMLSGNSSGAICAFTAAWQRPDMFSKVFSVIGTYVPMRGGNEYPALIRKTEPKPLRIFLQDGRNDVWNPLFGSWFEANVLMESALRFAGYDMDHVWGDGGHDAVQATEIFPDVMRWLWRDWPQEVGKGRSQNDMLGFILDPQENWVPTGISLDEGAMLLSDINGNVYAGDGGKFYNIANDKKEAVPGIAAGDKVLASGGGKFYSTDGEGVNVYENGRKSPLLKNLPGVESVLIKSQDTLYISQLDGDKVLIWQTGPGGDKKLLTEYPGIGAQLALFPDHSMLAMSEDNSHWIYNAIIKEDGSLDYNQQWYWLHNSDNSDTAPKGNMHFDIHGNLYVATSDGIQVCDHNGRVRAILTLPSGKITSLCFGGKDLKTLYAVSGGKLYRRKLNVGGTAPGTAPVKVQTQGIG